MEVKPIIRLFNLKLKKSKRSQTSKSVTSGGRSRFTLDCNTVYIFGPHSGYEPHINSLRTTSVKQVGKTKKYDCLLSKQHILSEFFNPPARKKFTLKPHSFFSWNPGSLHFVFTPKPWSWAKPLWKPFMC